MDGNRNILRSASGRVPRRASLRRRGFTLIEACLTTVIIGTGVLAIVAAQQAYIHKNEWAQRAGTGMLLANELREMTLSLPLHDPISGVAVMGAEANELGVTDYDDLDDFAGPVDATGFGTGMTFDPPINALRLPVGDLDGWSQTIDVANVLPANISSTFVQPLGSTELVRVTVNVKYQKPGAETPLTVAQLSWVVGKDQ